MRIFLPLRFSPFAISFVLYSQILCYNILHEIIFKKENLNNLLYLEIDLLNKYNLLIDKNKGKVENFIDERLNEQDKLQGKKCGLIRIHNIIYLNYNRRNK